MPPIPELFDGGFREHISAIDAAVLVCCPDVNGSDWSEIVREFADDHSFLSVSLGTRPGERIPTCLIEFGAQADGERLMLGWLTGGWLKEHSRLEGIDGVATLDRSGDLGAFVKGLALYQGLPMVASEVATA